MKPIHQIRKTNQTYDKKYSRLWILVKKIEIEEKGSHFKVKNIKMGVDARYLILLTEVFKYI